MAQKVELVRTTDFEAIDSELTEAMDRLDSTNERIAELLASETEVEGPSDDASPEDTEDDSASATPEADAD